MTWSWLVGLPQLRGTQGIGRENHWLLLLRLPAVVSHWQHEKMKPFRSLSGLVGVILALFVVASQVFLVYKLKSKVTQAVVEEATSLKPKEVVKEFDQYEFDAEVANPLDEMVKKFPSHPDMVITKLAKQIHTEESRYERRLCVKATSLCNLFAWLHFPIFSSPPPPFFLVVKLMRSNESLNSYGANINVSFVSLSMKLWGERGSQ